jgi:hypothetical protein
LRAVRIDDFFILLGTFSFLPPMNCNADAGCAAFDNNLRFTDMVSPPSENKYLVEKASVDIPNRKLCEKHLVLSIDNDHKN